MALWLLVHPKEVEHKSYAIFRKVKKLLILHDCEILDGHLFIGVIVFYLI